MLQVAQVVNVVQMVRVARVVRAVLVIKFVNEMYLYSYIYMCFALVNSCFWIS